ncbi:MAG: oligopeptidase A [Methylococcales bacterium]
MTNPLLEPHNLPPFSQIKPEHIEPAITQILDENRNAINTLLEATKDYTWENLIQPMEQLSDRLNKAWSPVGHMNAVVNSDELRDAYNACLPKLSEYSTEIGHNDKLYHAYLDVSNHHDFASLDLAQQKIINDALRDFKLSGIALNTESKARFKEIEQRLSKLNSKFEENVMDATQGWRKNIDDVNNLKGLPDTALALAKQTAEQQEQQGWLLTLDFPSYIAVMTYADNRALRQEVYEAFCTRASDQGPFAGKWDNTKIMEETLALRHEKAGLLGFDSFADLSLVTKMANSPAQVLSFLYDLAKHSLPVARKDLEELRSFAIQHCDIDDLKAWDVTYISEKLRQHRYDLSQEEVKTYFPAPTVISGLFAVVNKLYGLDIQPLENIDTWHQDVRFYEIRDRNGQIRGHFYLDLYARLKKRGGAWMDECITRTKLEMDIQIPVAYLTCNFTPPTGEQPALLTHDEVTTLFHEFGHGLHHLLTQVDYLSVSGIHGVEWDAVELPSQFMENWCWDRESLDLISGHFESGEKLPTALYQKMLDAKNFQSGMFMIRQLEFSIFDFLIHQRYDPEKGGHIYEILDQVRKEVAVLIPPDYNRFAHSFSHIFAGGYAAGYYSYKWAEVLSADAFSLFEEKGIFDSDTGQSFLHNVLEKGGSQNAMELFVAFRGREPEIDALLRHNGIAA